MVKIYRNRFLVLLLAILLLFTVTPEQGQAAPPAQEPPPDRTERQLIDRLKQETGDTVRISYHRDTGKVRFIGAAPDRAIRQPSALRVGASPEQAGRAFLATYGRLFGLQDADDRLSLLKEQTLDDGRSFVRFQQTYRDVPVVGGELIVQMNKGLDVISVNGELLPQLDLEVTPTVDADTARQMALTVVAKDHNLNPNDLSATEPELWIYNPVLLGGPGPRLTHLVWRMEVTPLELLPIRQLVLVEARMGFVVLHFNQVHSALDRQIYDNNNNPALGLPGNGPVRSEGDGPTSISDVDLAYDYSGDTYNFYLNEHSRDSLDGMGMTLISTTRYCPNAGSCPFFNAFWNGSQMVYGNGFAAADDVVGHELTHGVTEFSSNLFYYFQSGAINESLSDVWGEFIDQTNGAGTDTAPVKWRMGEDVPLFGAIRDMKDPTAFNDPDRMMSPFYVCEQTQLFGSDDNGGVHSNSGVNNKAAYLMTDGDTFNGFTVTGLGIPKVADLYYEAQTKLLVSGSDYADLYDALIQAGINLGYSPADQQEVKDALDAVEMNQQPGGCPAPEAPVCESGQPLDLFFDDIESGGGNWSAGSNLGAPFWFVPQTSSSIGFADPYAASGTGNIWGPAQGDTSDTFLAMNSDVALPANAYLHFNHAFGFESNSAGTVRYDGGILEYSTTGGTSWNNGGSLFTHNGYNGLLEASNPLGPIPAFSADSRGYISSRLNLGSLAGQNVRFRFRIGTDAFVLDYGWFIDDVRIYTCGPAPSLDFSSYIPLILKQ